MSPPCLAQSRDISERLRAFTGRGQIAAATRMALPGNQSPWQSTGLQVQRGQAYSVFAEGRIRWSQRHPHLYGGPRFHLWARINPAGRAVNLRADTGTFVADADGTLEFGIYMGMWADKFGTLRSSTALYQNIECPKYSDDVQGVMNHHRPTTSSTRKKTVASDRISPQPPKQSLSDMAIPSTLVRPVRLPSTYAFPH